MPFSEDGGLSLSPGRASLIGIKKVSKINLLHPLKRSHFTRKLDTLKQDFQSTFEYE